MNESLKLQSSYTENRLADAQTCSKADWLGGESWIYSLKRGFFVGYTLF